jgi:geranylgeranyl diphosphate synthase type I
MALAPYQEPINRWVADYYAEEARNTPGEPGDIVSVIDQYVAEFASAPAKRLRGSLVLAAYEKLYARDPSDPAALQLAGLLEVSQDYLLTIDDWMDRSPLRRGGPTMHMRFRDYLESQGYHGDLAHAGDTLAVDTGLILSHKIQLLINSLPIDAETRSDLSNIYNLNMVTTGRGQAYDQINGLNGLSTERQIIKMLTWKTAFYSVAGPLDMAARLAGASKNDRAALREFGVRSGTVYQVRDDLLDATGDPEKTGKPVHSDLREGRVNLVIYHMLKHANEEDKAFIQSVRGRQLSDGPYSDEDVHERINRVFIRTGAEKYVERIAMHEASVANRILATHPKWRLEGVQFLRSILRWMLLRDS